VPWLYTELSFSDSSRKWTPFSVALTQRSPRDHWRQLTFTTYDKDTGSAVFNSQAQISQSQAHFSVPRPPRAVAARLPVLAAFQRHPSQAQPTISVHPRDLLCAAYECDPSHVEPHFVILRFGIRDNATKTLRRDRASATAVSDLSDLDERSSVPPPPIHPAPPSVVRPSTPHETVFPLCGLAHEGTRMRMIRSVRVRMGGGRLGRG
jgi:hypothetical protein